MFIESLKRFQCFIRHHNFHNVKVSSEAESAHTEGAEAFKEELHSVTVDEKYLPEQILNDNKTNLFWKGYAGAFIHLSSPRQCQDSKH